MVKVHLSVSSIILATVLTGCSQNQHTQSEPRSTGIKTKLSQVIAELSKPEKMSPDSFYESKSHRKERLARLSRLKLEAERNKQKSLQVKPKKVSVAKSLKGQRLIYKATPLKVKRVVKVKPRPVRSIQKLPLALLAKKVTLVKSQEKRCSTKVKLPAKYITKSRRVFVQKATVKRVLIRAPQYRWVNKKVLVRKATYKTKVTSAKYKIVKHKTTSKRVLLRPARNIRTFVPAVYKTVKQKVLIASARYKTVQTPPRYKTQTYRQKVASARYVWRSALCKVNAPKHVRKAKVSKRKLVKQHRRVIKVKQRPVITKKLFKRAADEGGYMKLDTTYNHSIRVVNTKPVKRKLSRKKAIDKDISNALVFLSKVKFKKEKTLKKPKKRLNKTEAKRRMVINIQKSLKAKGFDPRGIDGKLGAWTASALKAFQRSRGLDIGKLDTNTLRALGIVRA